MATPQELATDSSCNFCAIPPGEVPYVLIALLQTLNGTSMTPQELVSQTSCLRCVIPPGEAQYVIIYLLQQLIAGGGGGGSTQVFSGNYAGGTPSDVPTGSAAIAIDTSNGTVWYYYGGGWH